jgi:thiosulfate/3-mercaptopyruvate sulfurtransferase
MFTTLISTEALSQHLEHPDWLVVDCRFSLAETQQGRKAYQQSHIPNARYAHLNEDLSGEIIPGKTGRHPLPEIPIISQTFSQWGIDEAVQVVAYDDAAGMVAARLWWMLRWLGHDSVAVLDGGWQRWRQENRPVTAEIVTRPARNFLPKPRLHWIVDADFVQANRENPSHLLFDCRAADRYRGENETIDPVAGHIPGAISLPYAENVAADGKFLPPAALRKRFREYFLENQADQAIFYCGSGVSACHNLLALKHAGLGDALLYAGSWSDWITDSSRPVERG